MTRRDARKIFRLLRKINAIMSGGGCPLKKSGERWERRVAMIATRRGFVTEPAESKSAKYDLLVNGLRVQCKKRTLLPNGKVKLCFCARRAAGATKEAYLVGEFDVLCMKCNGLVYVIPSLALGCGDGVTMKNEIDPSQYQSYVDNWGVLSAAA